MGYNDKNNARDSKSRAACGKRRQMEECIMGIFETISQQITDTITGIFEKNHRSAIVNRLRIVIKNERENCARAYVALGKYYYEHLRDKENQETEALCTSIDESTRRMQRAFDKMHALHEEAVKEAEARAKDPGNPACVSCTDDCTQCSYNVGVNIASEAAPYDKYDTTPSPIANDPDNIEVDAVPAPQPPQPAPAPDTEAADDAESPNA